MDGDEESFWWPGRTGGGRGGSWGQVNGEDDVIQTDGPVN